MKNEGVTLGQLLDIIDKTRKDEESYIQIMMEGFVACKASLCWDEWKYLEHRFVDCIQADSLDVISVWLKPERDCYHCKYYVEEQEHNLCTFCKDVKDCLEIDDLRGCDFWEEKEE